MNFFSIIESAGIPALRIAASIAVLITAGAGLFVYHKRHELFDRDPQVENDIPAARHIRLEEIALVWGALMLVLLSFLCQVWLD